MICVKYLGSSKDQVRWGENDDPAECLKIGVIYIVELEEVFPWYTKLRLLGFPGKEFNLASFQKVEV